MTRPSSPYGYILSASRSTGAADLRSGRNLHRLPLGMVVCCWLTLMPGESRTLVTGVDEGDTRGEKVCDRGLRLASQSTTL